MSRIERRIHIYQVVTYITCYQCNAQLSKNKSLLFKIHRNICSVGYPKPIPYRTVIFWFHPSSWITIFRLKQIHKPFLPPKHDFIVGGGARFLFFLGFLFFLIQVFLIFILHFILLLSIMYMTYIVTTCMNVFDFSISMRGSRGGQDPPPPPCKFKLIKSYCKITGKKPRTPSPPPDKQNYIHVCIHIPHTPQPSKFFLDPRMISAT